MSDVLLQVIDPDTRQVLATLPTVPFIREGEWPHTLAVEIPWREKYDIRADGFPTAVEYTLIVQGGKNARGYDLRTSLPMDDTLHVEVIAYDHRKFPVGHFLSSSRINLR